MYKIAICDDNSTTVDHIAGLISKNMEVPHKIFKYLNSTSLEFFIHDVLKGELDILVIDIDLVSENGIKVAERLKKQYMHIRIIFISGQIYFAGDIFETKPIYFLVKPIDESRLISAMKMAIQDINSGSKDTIKITTKGIVLSLELRLIRYIESSRRMVLIYEDKQTREIHLKLDLLEEAMPDKFCRCHQSFIVNFDYVTQLSLYQFTLSDGKTVPVSQLKYQMVKQRFMRYLGNSL